MNKQRRHAFSFGLALGMALGPARAQQLAPSAANPVAGEQLKLSPAYLPREALPDSLALLPPPPAQGSAALRRDEEARDAAMKRRGTARFRQAATDADLGFPKGPAIFRARLASQSERR